MIIYYVCVKYMLNGKKKVSMTGCCVKMIPVPPFDCFLQGLEVAGPALKVALHGVEGFHGCACKGHHSHHHDDNN